MRKILDQETARYWWDYNPKTGSLAWRNSPSVRAKVGQEAGCLRKDYHGKIYRQVRLKGYGQPMVHLVIYTWMTGYWPVGEEQIDHEDGNGLNNCWGNLRLVSGHVEQMRNQRLSSANTTGVIGVHFDKRREKYVAQIGLHGARLQLGRFTRFEDAVAARMAASELHNFHPNHGQERPL